MFYVFLFFYKNYVMRVKRKWNVSNSFQAKQSELNMSLNLDGELKIIDKYFITNYKIPSASFLYRKKKGNAASRRLLVVKLNPRWRLVGRNLF